MTGTEVMVVADLNEMEARVDIGEVDVVLIALNQKTRLEVEAFRAVSYTHLRAHETVLDLVCRLLLEKKKKQRQTRTHYK